ncbi:ADP ribosylation factor family Ras family Ras of Complex Roc domain [Trypanosoma vivax]|uniref:Putative small GTP-binding rab protein n=1 Tax=Trypanosoma vivax (strain Y486) TaxID=1055687 RepID=G0TUT2_TRYVY|nr:putative small GTP-binding rab protein [Trypanosoma vivax]KAH8617646.1 ADP ribosylation factor family Ras family Ras of Complex Roc domain [Trypanosoma vivax]CCC47719.1 putative small GTP-binding rab protein [Trypanosoma vivax Y486]
MASEGGPEGINVVETEQLESVKESSVGSVNGKEEGVDEQNEFVFKVVVAGDYAVGKTSVVRRLLTASYGQPDDEDEETEATEDVNSRFTARSTKSESGGNEGDKADSDAFLSVVPTVGTDFFSRVVRDVVPGQHVRLQFWDTAGLERYAAVHASTYRNASAVLTVFDVSNAESFQHVIAQHLKRIAEHNPNIDVRDMYVIGNKVDLISNSEPEELLRFTSKHDLRTKLLSVLPSIQYFEVSARSNYGISDLLRSLCESLLFNFTHGPQSSVFASERRKSVDERLACSLLPEGAPQSALKEEEAAEKVTQPPPSAAANGVSLVKDNFSTVGSDENADNAEGTEAANHEGKTSDEMPTEVEKSTQKRHVDPGSLTNQVNDNSTDVRNDVVVVETVEGEKLPEDTDAAGPGVRDTTGRSQDGDGAAPVPSAMHDRNFSELEMEVIEDSIIDYSVTDRYGSPSTVSRTLPNRRSTQPFRQPAAVALSAAAPRGESYREEDSDAFQESIRERYQHVMAGGILNTGSTSEAGKGSKKSRSCAC